MATIKGSWMKWSDCEVSYEITDEMKDQIIQKLIEYYSKNCHSGEGIFQDDDSLIEAPEVLADIADHIIKFKSSYKEDETN